MLLATFTSVSASDLIADINAINTAGGSHTIILAPATTFSLQTTNNTTNGPTGLPVIGGMKAVDLTIVGNGNTIERIGWESFRLFDVAPGAALTLEQVTLQGGQVNYAGRGGGIFNRGTLTVTSGSVLTGNKANSGGGIFNAGTATVSNSTLYDNAASSGGGIFNAGTLDVENSMLSTNNATNGGGIYNVGTATVSNSALTGSSVNYGGGIYNSGGAVTLSHTNVSHNWAFPDYSNRGGYAAGIYNDAAGTVTVENSSSITNEVWNFGVVYLDSTSTIGSLYGNPAIPIDSNTPRLQIRDAAVAEGNTGSVAATFTVTLSVASAGTITVAYATADGTAAAGGDYQAASGTLTFAPGETSKSVTVLVNGDRLAEPNETFAVKLSRPTGAAVADWQGLGTITDDEPRISIGDVTRAEGQKNQTTLFTFTVTLSAAYDQAVTVSYRTPSGTAKAGEDYVGKTGTLTFAPGETSKTITIEVKGDGKREADEYFYLDLFGNSGNSLLNKNRGLGTILNDD